MVECSHPKCKVDAERVVRVPVSPNAVQTSRGSGGIDKELCVGHAELLVQQVPGAVVVLGVPGVDV